MFAFLRHLLADGVPAWKRLKVVENLGTYRDEVFKTGEPELEFVKMKLKETVALEQGLEASDEPMDTTITMEDIKEIAGIIDPNEPEPLQPRGNAQTVVPAEWPRSVDRTTSLRMRIAAQGCLATTSQGYRF